MSLMEILIEHTPYWLIVLYILSPVILLVGKACVNAMGVVWNSRQLSRKTWKPYVMGSPDRGPGISPYAWDAGESTYTQVRVYAPQHAQRPGYLTLTRRFGNCVRLLSRARTSNRGPYRLSKWL